MVSHLPFFNQISKEAKKKQQQKTPPSLTQDLRCKINNIHLQQTFTTDAPKQCFDTKLGKL